MATGGIGRARLKPGGAIKIKGDTDQTLIGNVGDSLKVTSATSATPGSPVISKKLRYDFSTSAVVLTASYQTILSYTGSGKFCSFAVQAEASQTEYKLTIDSTEVIFEVTGLIMQAIAHSVNYQIGPFGLTVTSDAKRFLFNPPFPIPFSSNVKLEARESGGKRIFERVLTVTKET